MRCSRNELYFVSVSFKCAVAPLSLELLHIDQPCQSMGGGGIGRSSSTELATMRIAVSRKRFGCVRVIGHSESVLEPYASSGYRGSARELTELHSLATRSTQDDFPIAHGRTVYRHSKMATIKGCSARLTSK